MSYRAHGIPLSFKLDTDTVSEKKVGQLVALKTDGSYTTEMDNTAAFALPLIEDVDKQAGSVAVTVSGVAKVYVEDAEGIVAGSEVGIGATGLGAAAYESGYLLGVALAKPAGDGDFIPVLLTPKAAEAAY